MNKVCKDNDLYSILKGNSQFLARTKFYKLDIFATDAYHYSNAISRANVQTSSIF